MMKKMWVAAAVLAFVGSLGWAAGTAGTPINSKCPIKAGKDANAQQSSDVAVKFCTPACKGKFDKDPFSGLGKIDKMPNDKCPMDGKPVAMEQAVVTVGFCCAGCKGKFDKDPVKILKNVKK